MKKLYLLAMFFLFNATLVEGHEIGILHDASEKFYKGSEYEKDKAIDFLEKSVGPGDEQILRILRGHVAMRQLGWNVDPSYKADSAAAYRYLRLSTLLARHGTVEDKYDLAEMYAEGSFGVKQDSEKAFQWFSLAAEAGHTKSQIALSKMYRNGEGVEKDEFKAYELISSAAKSGDEDALYRLADYLENGVGTSVDIEGCIRVLKKIASSDSLRAPFATFRIGFLYAEGNGILQNHSEAIKWISKAASITVAPYKRGYPYAQNVLGLMYASGLYGVKRDLIKAHMWFNLAASQGNSDAANARDNLVLSGSEIAKARLLAKNWKPSR